MDSAEKRAAPTRRPIILIACAAILVAVLSAPRAASAADHDFELFTLDDKLYKLERVRQAEGNRVVVVDFFAMSCKPCREGLEAWSELHRKSSERGLAMVVVALPEGDDRAAYEASLRDLFKAKDLPFPVVFDKYSKVARQYGVSKDGEAKLPSAFLIDRSGKVAAKGKDAAALAGEVERLLTGKAGS
jgi:peroxiredoxin